MHVAPNVLAVACGLRHSLVLRGSAAVSGLDRSGARHLDEGLQEQHPRSRSQESTQLLGFGSNRKGQLLDACASQTAAVAAAAHGGRGIRGRQDTAVFWPVQIHGLRDIGAVLQVSCSKQVLFCTCGKNVELCNLLVAAYVVQRRAPSAPTQNTNQAVQCRSSCCRLLLEGITAASSPQSGACSSGARLQAQHPIETSSFQHQGWLQPATAAAPQLQLQLRMEGCMRFTGCSHQIRATPVRQAETSAQQHRRLLRPATKCTAQVHQHAEDGPSSALVGTTWWRWTRKGTSGQWAATSMDSLGVVSGESELITEPASCPKHDCSSLRCTLLLRFLKWRIRLATTAVACCICAGPDCDVHACSAPVKVTGLPGGTASMVSAGAEHSVALTKQGELYAWGWNSHGQLGLGHSTDCFTPACVVPAASVGAHTSSSCWLNVACGCGFTVGVWEP